MKRRQFIQAAIAAATLPNPVGVAIADSTRVKLFSRVAVSRLLARAQLGFPTIIPIFAAGFVSGAGPMQLIQSESWTNFISQAQILAGTGLRLSCYTSLQNLNRTWFYGAFQPGSGSYYFLRTADLATFQQTFTQRQSGYTLVDFNVAWEQGQLFYSGYWLAAAVPKSQSLIWDVNSQSFFPAANLLEAQGMRMTRIQAFPQQSVTAFAALFEAASDPFVVYYAQPDTFASEVTTNTAYALNGIAFDPVKAYFAGCFRFKTGLTQFLLNQDWNSVAAAAQTATASGLGLRCITAYPDAPSFEDFFSANLAPFVMGYAYAVAKDGQVIASGSGFARSPQEAQNAGSPFTIDTRMNLASVSKFITGITLTGCGKSNSEPLVL